ncbi:MAG: dienelactone hydrolase family protein [Phototrophicaceae bacterium]
MPLHDSNRLEFAIDSGHINIIMDNGKKVPAYWAHPRIGHRFSGICLLHDWWGMDHVSRMLANFFAQMGYYVIEPDLFAGRTANTPQQAMRLLEETKHTRYEAVNATLSVLESHHRINTSVAAIGMGMGGSLAFEAAIKRDDLEAAVSYSGFPQQFRGQFAQCNTPILAVYGSEEPYTKPPVIAALKQEFMETSLKDQHQVMVIKGGDHQIFSTEQHPDKMLVSKIAINRTLSFLENYLESPQFRDKPSRY